MEKLLILCCRQREEWKRYENHVYVPQISYEPECDCKGMERTWGRGVILQPVCGQNRRLYVYQAGYRGLFASIPFDRLYLCAYSGKEKPGGRGSESEVRISAGTQAGEDHEGLPAGYRYYAGAFPLFCLHERLMQTLPYTGMLVYDESGMGGSAQAGYPS